jgi:hypothetical protein
MALMNAPNLALGICLVFLGTALALDRLGVMEAHQLLRFWPLGIVLLGLGLVIQALRPATDGGGVPHQRTIQPGHIIAIVVIGIIFSHTLQRTETMRQVSDQTVDVLAVMGRHERVSSASQFRGGQVTAVMGRAELDLRQATLEPGQQADLEVFALMGGLSIRVPEGWEVDVRAVPIMGGINRRNRGGAPSVPGAPRVVVRGFIMMGGISIRS